VHPAKGLSIHAKVVSEGLFVEFRDIGHVQELVDLEFLCLVQFGWCVLGLRGLLGLRDGGKLGGRLRGRLGVRGS
jgi:hypothetical protein